MRTTHRRTSIGVSTAALFVLIGTAYASIGVIVDADLKGKSDSRGSAWGTTTQILKDSVLYLNAAADPHGRYEFFTGGSSASGPLAEFGRLEIKIVGVGDNVGFQAFDVNGGTLLQATISADTRLTLRGADIDIIPGGNAGPEWHLSGHNGTITIDYILPLF